MKSNKYISKTERLLLIAFSFIAFGFIFLVAADEVTRSYNYSVREEQQELQSQAGGPPNIRFSGSGVPHIAAGHHLLTLFIFIALIVTKRFLLPSILTVFYAVVFIYGLSIRYDEGRYGGEDFSPKVDFFDQIYQAADYFDYIAAFFISILLFWQIAILLRIFIKILRRKNQLS